MVEKKLCVGKFLMGILSAYHRHDNSGTESYISVEINVASFSDSSVVQLAGDHVSDMGGIFITAGNKVRVKYKQNNAFEEVEIDIVANTWHRIEQYRVKLLDKVKRKVIEHSVIEDSFQHINEVRVDGKVYLTKIDPNVISTGPDIRIMVAGHTPFDGTVRDFYYDLNRGLPLTSEYLGRSICDI